MRYALTVGLLIIGLFGFGQVYQSMPQAGYGPVKRFLISSDGVLSIPIGIDALRNITGGRDTAQIRYVKADSSLYVYTGATWVKVGSGAAAFDSTSLSNRINLKLNISDTASKWVGHIERKTDSIIVYEGSTRSAYYMPSSGGSGSATYLAQGYGVLIDSTTTPGVYIVSLDTTAIATQYDLEGKQNLVTLTTTGSSGAATFNPGTGALNIPNYAGGGGSSSVDSTERFLGNLYSGRSFANISDFVNDGATVSAVSGNLNFSGGANTYTQTLNYPQYSALDRFTIKDTIKITEKSATSYGFGLGIRSYATAQTFSTMAKFDASTGGSSGKLIIVTEANGTWTTRATSSGTLSFSANDSVDISVERDRFIFTATVRNITTNNAPVTVTYNFPFANGNVVQTPNVNNTGRYAIFSLGGTFSVVSHRISSKASKYARLLLTGDSKTVAQTAGSYESAFPTIIENAFYNSVVVDAGGSDRLQDMINKTPEMILLRPKSLAISAPSNDLRGGTTGSALYALYDTLANRITAAGIPLYHILGFYEAGIDQTGLIAHIKSTYPGSAIIDTYTPTTQANLLTSDNVHLNTAGNLVVANTIKNAIVIPGRQPYYTLPTSVFNASQLSSLDTTNGTFTVGTTTLNDTYGTSFVKFMKGTSYFGFNGTGSGASPYFIVGNGTTAQDVWMRPGTTAQVGTPGAAGLAIVTNNVARHTISSAGVQTMAATDFTLGATASMTFNNTATTESHNFSAANSVFEIVNATSTQGQQLRVRNTAVSGSGLGSLIMDVSGSSVPWIGGARGDGALRMFSTDQDKKLFLLTGNQSTDTASVVVLPNGRTALGGVTASANAIVTIAPGETIKAPLKFTSGTNLTTPENGAVEYDGTNYFVTSGSVRYTLQRVTTVPASASATGVTGSMAYDTNFIYICVATNTWVRAALATW